MKRIYTAYKEIMGIFFSGSPLLVIVTITAAMISGFVAPLTLWVNSHIFDYGLLVASGELSFWAYVPYLVLFIVLSLLPVVVGDLFIRSYIQPRCQLILRTTYKEKMLQKLKKIRYEHLESAESMEIIDKAYNKTEGVMLSLFPLAVQKIISSGFATVGTLYLFTTVKWWLLLVIIPPFVLETWLAQKSNYNIYNEMERYWKKERSYTTLGRMLRSRDYVRENTLNGISNYLINTYRKRMNNRNREYERYYLRHLVHNFTKRNITKIIQLMMVLLLLRFYINGEIKIGMLISLSQAVFTSLFSDNGLNGLVQIFRKSGQHIKAFEFYDQYFSLSEDEYGNEEIMPDNFDIEFDNVFFTYPGTEKKVLDGLTFKISQGEKVSIVGKNGEGKSTVIKLLLGLFQPDSGEIRIGHKPIMSYSQDVRNRLFGAVFQDFVKYNMTLGENIGIGNMDKLFEESAIVCAMGKAKVDSFVEALPNGVDTLLGREFEGGVDLSGGQWQRIAIARAFMGEKPILILDEPTSQLDPMAESQIYSEFAQMSEGKTSIFIAHRLASTMITDRILVVANGKVMQSGTHDELMRQGGLYADMFQAQKQWYVNQEGEEEGVYVT